MNLRRKAVFLSSDEFTQTKCFRNVPCRLLNKAISCGKPSVNLLWGNWKKSIEVTSWENDNGLDKKNEVQKLWF